MTNQTPKINKLVAIYARVSTGRQENEQTVQNQLMVLHDHVEKNDYTIVSEYVDEGWSGDILARPQLDRLRVDAKNKMWEAVLVYDPDRIARRYSYQELIMDELKEAGMEMIFITTAAPKNSEDKILYGVRGLFAEYERAKIAERFRLGKLRKVRNGHVLVSEAPYGYTYVPRKSKQSGGFEHGYYEVNNQEAEVVKMMFSWIADDGLTIRGIIKKLRELNIPPRESKRGVWSTSTLSTLLRNATYIGEAHYGKSYAVVPEKPLKNEVYKKVKKTSRRIKSKEEWIIIPVPNIINRELFEKVGRQLTINYALCSRNKKNEYLLAGKVYCTCGCRRVGEGPMHGKHLYYRCTDRIHNYPLPKTCLEKGMNARIADRLVWDKLENLICSPELIMKKAKEWFGKQHIKTEQSGTSVDSLKKELDKLRKEENRYLKAYGASVITLEQFSAHSGDLKTQMLSIKGQILSLEQQKNQSQTISLPTDDELKQFCQKAKDMLNYLSFEVKQKAIRGIIERVTGNKLELSVDGYLPINLNNNYAFMSVHSDSADAARNFEDNNNTLSKNYAFKPVHRHRRPA
ncbi:MAG: recombinase family protein [bacterium]|nr:recombinase family protein [bacterium]